MLDALPVECCRCGYRGEKLVSWLVANPTFACPAACGAMISVPQNDLSRCTLVSAAPKPEVLDLSLWEPNRLHRVTGTRGSRPHRTLRRKVLR